MEYRVSKISGWLLLAISLWLTMINYKLFEIYILLCYCILWVVLANNWLLFFRHQRKLFMCLQFGAILLVGMQIFKRWLFVYREQSFGVIHNDVSPAALLIGAVFEGVILLILLASFIEVMLKKDS
jgi:hypothetical protein